MQTVWLLLHSLNVHDNLSLNKIYTTITTTSVTSATIQATLLEVSRHTGGSILERNRLLAISTAFLAGIQAVWSITDFRTLARNPLLATNANTHAGSPVIWNAYEKHIYEASTVLIQHPANGLFLCYWPWFVLILEGVRTVKKSCKLIVKANL